MFETQRLTEDGQVPVAAINILLSLAVGVGAIALGRAIGVHI
jgi:fluoride ion exporter CrcB/FEX